MEILKEVKMINPNFKIYLIGNILDKEEDREVSQEEVEKFGEKIGINNYFEMSCKTGENIEKVFETVAK